MKWTPEHDAVIARKDLSHAEAAELLGRTYHSVKGRRALTRGGRRCELPGCERPHSAKGLCQFHRGRQRKGRKLDAPWGDGRGMKGYFDWAACGTPAQYRKHYRYNIPMCDECRRAESLRTSRYSDVNQGNPPRRWTPDEDVVVSSHGVNDAAKLLGRSVNSVKHRRAVLKKLAQIQSQSLIGNKVPNAKLETAA